MIKHFLTTTDFSREDRILFTGASLPSFTFSLSGDVLTYTGGSLTLPALRFASLAANAAPEGGVQITFSGPPLVLSSGASVAPASVSRAAAQATNVSDWIGPATSLPATSHFGGHENGWHARSDGGPWQAATTSEGHLFGIL